nr:hypothetical protein Q903MT_gene76 [Picea sitchensis]
MLLSVVFRSPIIVCLKSPIDDASYRSFMDKFLPEGTDRGEGINNYCRNRASPS